MSNKAAILSEYEDILEASNKKLQIEETLFSEMLSTADSIFRNQSVSPFIKFNYINDDLKIIVLKTLQQYANDIPNLGSIYAYAVYSDYVALVRSQNVVELVEKEEFTDLQLKKIFQDRENLRNDVVYARSIDPKYGGGEANNYTFIGFEGTRMPDGPGYCVVINMPESWLTNYIYETDDDYNRILIVDSNGKAITSSAFAEFGSDSSQIDFVNDLLADESAGYFTTKIDNVDTLVVYTFENRFGHRIITLKSVSKILKPQTAIRLTIILVSIILLILAVFTGYAFLRYAYRPIDTALKNAIKSDIQGMRAQEILRSRFIYNLISDRRFARHVKNEDLDRMEIPIRIEKPLFICCMQIDNVDRFESTYDTDTKQAYSFAIRNVASELFSEKFIVASANVKSRNSIVILMNSYPVHSDVQSREIVGIIQKVIDAIRETIDLSISASYLYPPCEFSSIMDALSCCEETLWRQRYVEGYGKVFAASLDMSMDEEKSSEECYVLQ